MKTLVAYFSASGVTRKVAETLAQAAGADLFEIVPAAPYTSADLDWRDRQSRSSREMNNKAFRPALAGTCGNLAEYDRVFLGFPIWWGVAPTVVNTFLESQDFSGKEIVIFATSGGSGLGNSAAELQPSAPGAVVRSGKLLSSRASENELKVWLDTL